MDELVRQTLLFDFYGELLTEKQRRIYQEVVFDDFSLSEVAAEESITRQGVHDTVRRTREALAEYESRLGLVRKHLEITERIRKIRETAAEGLPAAEKLEEVLRLTEEIAAIQETD